MSVTFVVGYFVCCIICSHYSCATNDSFSCDGFQFMDMETNITQNNGCWFLIRDEYKEFEKVIQEDLKEVDDRLEEEEVRLCLTHMLWCFNYPDYFWIVAN